MPLTTTRPRLHYQLLGTTGPEVVLVMGFGMTGSVWKPQTDDLARDHRLLFFDHRGIGQSPDPAGFPLRMADLASDVLRLVDEVGFRRPHLVGVSMGGMVAQEAALMRPEGFRSATLIATHPGRTPAALPLAGALANLGHAVFGDEDDRRKAMIELLYTPEFVANTDRDALDARMRAQFAKRARLGTLAAQLSAIARHDAAKRLPTLPMPVMLVRAGRDRLIRPAGVDRIARALPDAEVLRFDDAGHGVIYQKAAELNAALRAFIAREEHRVQA